MSNFPIIDFADVKDASPQFDELVGQTCDAARETGFFYVRGHGIPDSLIETVFAVAQRFFALPEKCKSEVAVFGSHRGYIRQGESVMDGYDGADRKESYIWGLDIDAESTGQDDVFSMLVPNRWHSGMPEMRTALNEYFDQTHKLAMRILRVLAAGLNCRDDSFTRNFTRPTSRGSLIYYPPVADATGSYGVSPHTDFGCLSLLLPGDDGLQVQTDSGDWLSVPPVPGTVVVNIGDLLERWSNGLFRSVPHCVVNAKPTARYSVVVFVDPDADTLIDPMSNNGQKPRFEPVRCDAYIASRFDRAFDYRK